MADTKTQTFPRLQILFAEYKGKEASKDVTGLLFHRLDANGLMIKASDDFNTIFGDPEPKTEKLLVIRYRYGDDGYVLTQEWSESRHPDIHLPLFDRPTDPMVGKLTVTVHKAVELKKTFAFDGKMDPYARLNIGKETFQTHVMKDADQAPVFEKSFIFNLDGKSSQFSIIILHQAVTTDDQLGRYDCNVNDITYYEAPMWYALKNPKNFKEECGKVQMSFTFRGYGGQRRSDPKAVEELKRKADEAAKAAAAAAAAAAEAAKPLLVVVAPDPKIEEERLKLEQDRLALQLAAAKLEAELELKKQEAQDAEQKRLALEREVKAKAQAEAARLAEAEQKRLALERELKAKSQAEADRLAAEKKKQEAEAAEKKRQAWPYVTSVHVLKCSQGHDLADWSNKVVPHYNSDKFCCDGCGSTYPMRTSKFFRCNSCNFDLCSSCSHSVDDLPRCLLGHRCVDNTLVECKEGRWSCSFCSKSSSVVYKNRGGKRYTCPTCPRSDVCGSCAIAQNTPPSFAIRDDIRCAKGHVTSFYWYRKPANYSGSGSYICDVCKKSGHKFVGTGGYHCDKCTNYDLCIACGNNYGK